MALVINWKAPKGVSTPVEVEHFFSRNGVSVNVSQTHRVPSGKLNTTIDGDDEQVQKAWRVIKEMEKEEIKQRLKRQGRLPQPLQ